jgi:hypothetical protein
MTTGENGRGYMIDKKDGSKPGNLSWVGEMVWLDNREALTAPVPMYDLGLALLVNGNFENGMNGWQDWGGCSVTRGVSHNGSAALILGTGTSGGAGQTMDLKPHTTYSLKVWGKGTADVGVKYKTSENDPNEYHNMLTFSTEEWIEKALTFTTPKELFGRTFFIWKGNTNATFQIDDIELIQVGRDK